MDCEGLEEEINYILKCHRLYGNMSSGSVQIIRKEILQAIKDGQEGEYEEDCYCETSKIMMEDRD